MARRAVIQISPNGVTLPTNRAGVIEYLTQFQTTEQKHLFLPYIDYCVGQRWIGDYSEGSNVTVDLENNTINIVFVEKEAGGLEKFEEYMTEKGYFTPIEQYFTADASRGTFSSTITES